MKDTKAPTVTDVVLQSGRLVANYGRQVIIEDATGARVACRLHGRRLSAVCGDHVQWGYAQSGDSTGIVYSLQPRERVLARLSALGTSEPIVANRFRHARIDDLRVVVFVFDDPKRIHCRKIVVDEIHQAVIL